MDIAELYRKLMSLTPEQQQVFLKGLDNSDVYALQSYIKNNTINSIPPTPTVDTVAPVADVATSAPTLGSGLGNKFPRLAGMFSNLKDPNKPLINSNLDLSLKGANNLLRTVGSKPITKPGGLTLGGLGMGLYGAKQGIDLFNEASNLSASYTDLNDIKDSAISSAYANPMVNSYLNSEDQKTLRQLRNGSFGQQNPVGAAAGGAVKNIPDALKSALVGYLVSGGNPVGAILGGGSSLIKGGMQGITNTNNEKANRLQALYSNLRNAEDDYNSMRRPSNLRAAGLSSRAYAGLY